MFKNDWAQQSISKNPLRLPVTKEKPAWNKNSKDGVRLPSHRREFQVLGAATEKATPSWCPYKASM